MTRAQVLLTMLGSILLAVAIFTGFYAPNAYKASIGFSTVGTLCFIVNWAIEWRKGREKHKEFWDDLTYMSFNVFKTRLIESLEIPTSPDGGITLYNFLLQRLEKDTGKEITELHRETILQAIECLNRKKTFNGITEKKDTLRIRAKKLLIEMRNTLAKQCMPANFNLPQEESNVLRILQCGGSQVVERVVKKLIDQVATSENEEKQLPHIQAIVFCFKTLILDVQNNTFPWFFDSGDTLTLFTDCLEYELAEVNKNPDWRDAVCNIIRECFDEEIIQQYLKRSTQNTYRALMDTLQGKPAPATETVS